MLTASIAMQLSLLTVLSISSCAAASLHGADLYDLHMAQRKASRRIVKNGRLARRAEPSGTVRPQSDVITSTVRCAASLDRLTVW